ncbi:MAG: succinate dehydrogenase, hydrophobic membrane anchor protein [Nitrococcus mobilis]|nr:succinate dehydrogenase, hydrophobic membrane anchor protein [Nitrococcus mobilis]
MSFRTPLKQALGSGASHSGTSRWWAQRVSSVALVPLLIWFIIGMVHHGGADYTDARAWLGSPITAVLTILTLAVSFYHGALGMQVIVEDYVGHETVRLALVVLVKFAAVVLAVAGIFAVLLVALGG